MPRVIVTPKLNDSINVPVNRKFKRRVIALAQRAGVKSHTRYTRQLLEKVVAVEEADGKKSEPAASAR